MLKNYMGMAPWGDPQREDVIMGPVISAKQRDRVMGYIDKGVDEGATLAVGGKRPEEYPKGYYVEPTMFTDVDNSMTIAQEEIFGPVLVVIPFEDDDDAVRLANDSRYGLSGGVVSASLRPGHGRGPPGAQRHHERQRRPLVRGRRAVRRLQGQRHRPAERHRRLRPVPGDQVAGVAECLTPWP